MFAFRIKCVLFVTSFVQSVNSVPISSVSRDARTTMTQLSMGNLNSCLSRMMCRMQEMEAAGVSDHKLIKTFLKAFTNQDSDEDESNETAQIPGQKLIKTVVKAFSNKESDEDESDEAPEKYPEKYKSALNPKKSYKRRYYHYHKNPRKKSPRMLMAYPLFNKMRQKMNLKPITQPATTVMPVVPTTIAPAPAMMNTNMCRTPRTFSITWVRHVYPTTAVPTAMAAQTVAPLAVTTPAPADACPLSNAQLQMMIFDTINMALGGAAGIGMTLAGALPPLPGGPGMQAPGQPQLSPLEMAMMNLNRNATQGFFANIRIPVSIETQQIEQKTEVPPASFQTFGFLTTPAPLAIPKVRYSDYYSFKRRIGKYHYPEPSKKPKVKKIVKTTKKPVVPASNANSESEEDSEEGDTSGEIVIKRRQDVSHEELKENYVTATISSISGIFSRLYGTVVNYFRPKPKPNLRLRTTWHHGSAGVNARRTTKINKLESTESEQSSE